MIQSSSARVSSYVRVPSGKYRRISGSAYSVARSPRSSGVSGRRTSRAVSTIGGGVGCTLPNLIAIVPTCDDGAVLLADVVAASAAVAATRARTAKAATIAALLRAADAGEVEPVTAWLSGETRQGRLGV